ncbi:zinc finger BED domain-containing protein RICESLEEPER 2-like [Carya illinoinensis]|uniref:zinc finger BED domain-containing protein RICESLEEPER 2-like n=1 Tax=Carya illinoinensis TaxID=32201 RepID=UPI001C71C4B1|nr:zinc finger BED domain-containing protein RICESLEEPER 2-like [Carya illinoinensis]
MGDPVNDVDPVEEYENESSVGISLVEAISDNDRDTAQNSQAPNIVSTEGPFTEVQTVAYERKKRKRTPDIWKDFVEIDSNGVKQPQFESKEADGAFTVSNFTYDRNRVRKLASHMILYHEYPFSLMEHVRHVLNFCNVPPPHTGLLIADALEKCFQNWEIENKISSITVDNASSNDVAIWILKDDFRLKKTLSVNGQLFHVRCCAHITNLLVQYGLGEIRDIVDCVRDGIKYLVASESRLKQFSEIAKQLQLPSKKLILDMPTRWNSTYLMLDAAIQFKKVFPRYGDRDRCFEWVPTIEEWGQVENICQLLAIFNEVTNIVSGSDYPTANLFLSEVWRMNDILGKKSRDENEYVKSMAAKNIDHVSTVLLELYNEYVHEYNSTLEAQREQDNARMNVSGSSSSVGTRRNMQSGQSLFKSFLRSVDTVQLSKSELDNYLEEIIYICEEGSDASFDALEWWKTNSLKFRTLSKLARDILATPITTVSSESILSTRGRVIDTHRASLKTETVQMLLCGSDWVRALYGLKRSSTNSVVMVILFKFGNLLTSDMVNSDFLLAIYMFV